MGSNLRARLDGKPRNEKLKPGEVAWRPPNGALDGLSEAKKWKGRDGAARQHILHGQSLEVDDTGEIIVTADGSGRAITVALARERGWGEVHADSYGGLLSNLHIYLNSTYRAPYDGCELEKHWLRINSYDRAKWGTTSSGAATPLSSDELANFSEYHYPVYACGYNWLDSNELSAKRLEEKISAAIAFWSKAGSKCEKVILITHSMGGLVARACARRIPDKIKGIVHGVMPALGAPVCYRRIACGTEKSSPSNGRIANKAMEAFSVIAGETAAETTPVMAYAAGPIELLPNHLFPKPWLFASTPNGNNGWNDLLSLPTGSPYDMYRDTSSWYRLFDLAIADPVERYEGAHEVRIREVIDTAERFHRDCIGEYYHPNTYAYFCDDPEQLSFGECRWTAGSQHISSSSLLNARFLSRVSTGARNIQLVDGRSVLFSMNAQSAPGDGTVPAQSGIGPQNKIKQIFRVRGFDHQASYNTDEMLRLTLHLVVRIMNG
jgi:pimeloyl-ACP methyl ester carboxylesterase